MRPRFKIEASGTDITDIIKDRVLKIRINDEAGQKSGTLDINLDDRDYKVDIPSAKARLKVWLGYEENSLTELGEYTVDEVTITENPAGINIRGKAADISNEFKATKTRSWHLQTIDQIVGIIASEHGLIPKVHTSYIGKMVSHIDQENESDMHFLTRLSKLYGATCKPAHTYLVFIPEGEGLSATGQALPSATIEREEILTLKASIKDRGNYSAVITRYHDKETNKEIEVEVRDRWQTIFGAGPVFRDKKLYTSLDMAEEAGKAKLKQLQAGTTTIDLTVRGRADIYAEQPITLTNVRDPIAGDWIIKTVTHELGSGGFTTKIVCGTKTDKSQATTTTAGTTQAMGQDYDPIVIPDDDDSQDT